MKMPESRTEKKEKAETQEVFKSCEVSAFPVFLVEKQTAKPCQSVLKSQNCEWANVSPGVAASSPKYSVIFVVCSA